MTLVTKSASIGVNFVCVCFFFLSSYGCDWSWDLDVNAWLGGGRFVVRRKLCIQNGIMHKGTHHKILYSGVGVIITYLIPHA